MSEMSDSHKNQAEIFRILAAVEKEERFISNSLDTAQELLTQANQAHEHLHGMLEQLRERLKLQMEGDHSDNDIPLEDLNPTPIVQDPVDSQQPQADPPVSPPSEDPPVSQPLVDSPSLAPSSIFPSTIDSSAGSSQGSSMRLQVPLQEQERREKGDE
jgi:hypothetical protein